nr:LAGLIDADG homing endonuclease [Oedogonium sp. 210]
MMSVATQWLCGFIDAEGCFNINITKRNESLNGYRIRLRFVLDQKDAQKELLYAKKLFKYGLVSLRSKTNNVYRYTIDSNIGCKNIVSYLSKYPLKTKKQSSFLKWYTVYQMILLKQHLTQEEEGLYKIIDIKKEINTNNSFFSLSMIKK